MKVYLGADHAGFKLKEAMKKYLDEVGVKYEDMGNHVYDKDDDYPDFAYAVASKIYYNPKDVGILFCGSSQGACIAANKVKSIRAASVRDVGEAKLAKAHDNANIICLPGGQQVQQLVKGIGLKQNEAKKVIKTFLETKFSKAKRHKRRIDKIKKIESKNFA